MQSKQTQDIVTPRLALIAITPESVLSEQQNDGSLAALVHAQIPPEWPPEHWEPHVLELLRNRFAADPADIGWHRYVALQREDGTRTLIGTLGGFLHAERPRECEVGYSILPAFQQQGYATEGMKAFVAWAFAHSFLQSAVAQTFPSLPASIRVMEKIGMHSDGPGLEEGTILYRLNREPTPSR